MGTRLEAAPLTPQPVITVKGLSALAFAETGSRQWVNAFGSGSPGGEFLCFADYEGNHFGKPTSSNLNGTTITQTYAWGTCTAAFAVLPDQTLEISGEIVNTSAVALGNVDLNLCKIDFPTDAANGLPAEKCWLEPGYYDFDASSTSIPCYFAFSDHQGWPGEVSLGQQNWGNNAFYARGVTLQPGHRLLYNFHLNFFSTSSELAAVQTAANEAFAVNFPQTHRAEDLRSVGQVFLVLGEGASGWAGNHNKWATNPRGWLGDPKIDIADKAAFKQRMVDFFHQILANARSVPEMRGIVFWDVEGEQYPHGASVYAGHPSWTARMAPEMDEILDDLMRILTDAGYQVGFCLRQQEIHDNPGNPEMAFFLKDWPTGSDSPEAIADLEHEIDWCRARFPMAKIFYVDSNEGDEIKCYEQLAAAYPDCLIFPESFYIKTRMYAYEPQYQTGRSQQYVRNGLQTQPQFVAVYPGAQSLINLADVANNDANVDSVAAAMIRGDVQMVRIWFGTAEKDLLQRATVLATAAGWPFAAPSPSPTPAPSPTPPPPVASYGQWFDELARWILEHPPSPNH
jgi:hypothetical protein